MKSGTRYGIFKVMLDCPHCGNPVVVNGPLLQPLCNSCLKQVDVPENFWTDMLLDYERDYGGLEPGSGSDATVMTGSLILKYTCVKLPPPDPACPSCGENWDIASLETGTDGEMKCGKCGRTTPVFPAPVWLSGKVATATQVFFADRETADADSVGEPAEALRPVALSCPRCGGGLVVSLDSQRLLPCKYCGVDVYLPDAVWLKLHPARTAKFWMVRFEGRFDDSARSSPESAGDPPSGGERRPG